ncbi:hypothetical protein BSKO_05850 [Bryopsis sp. KO-2023]|nr:hypothetical protein BSKO_05850 [Bryopsis sp. KO-2023]
MKKKQAFYTKLLVKQIARSPPAVTAQVIDNWLLASKWECNDNSFGIRKTLTNPDRGRRKKEANKNSCLEGGWNDTCENSRNPHRTPSKQRASLGDRRFVENCQSGIIAARDGMRLAPFAPDAAQTSIVRQTQPAKLCAAAAGVLSASHVIAAPSFLDRMVALGAALEIGPFQQLQQRHLLHPPRIFVVLRAGLRPTSMAPDYRHAFLIRMQLPASAPRSRAPPKLGHRLQSAFQQDPVILLEICSVGAPLDVGVLQRFPAVGIDTGYVDVRFDHDFLVDVLLDASLANPPFVGAGCRHSLALRYAHL